MITIAFFSAAFLIVASVVALAYAYRTAPEGHQDQHGFTPKRQPIQVRIPDASGYHGHDSGARPLA